VGITSPGRFLVRDGALADLPEKVLYGGHESWAVGAGR